jgi:hypothetical protein
MQAWSIWITSFVSLGTENTFWIISHMDSIIKLLAQLCHFIFWMDIMARRALYALQLLQWHLLLHGKVLQSDVQDR